MEELQALITQSDAPDVAELQMALSNVLHYDHLYFSYWSSNKVSDVIVRKTLKLIYVFDSDEFILSYILRFLVVCIPNFDGALPAESKELILKTVINLALYHKFPTICIQIIKAVIQTNPKDFGLLCQMCRLSVSQTKSSSIDPQNFAEFLNFISLQTTINNDVGLTKEALDMLSLIAIRVAPSMTVRLEVHSCLSVLCNLMTSYRLEDAVYCSAFTLLLEVLKLNSMYLSPRIAETFLPEIAKRIQAILSARKIEPFESVCAVLLKILTILGETKLIRNIIFNEIKLSDIIKFVKIISAKDANLLNCVVDLFYNVYMQIYNKRDDILLFAEPVLEKCAGSISYSEFVFLEEYCIVIMKFNRVYEFLFDWPELSASVGTLKSELIRLMEKNTFDGKKITYRSIDALVTLFGWREPSLSPPEVLSSCCTSRESIAKCRQSSLSLSLDSIKSDYSSLLTSYFEFDEFENDSRKLILDRIVPSDLFQKFSGPCSESSLDISDLGYFVLISRVMGASYLCNSIYLDVLADLTIGTLNSVNQSASESEDELDLKKFSEVREKCLQLLTDIIIESKLGAKPYVSLAYDGAMEIINSWNGLQDVSILYTCFSVYISCALVNESVRRHISSHLIKFHRLMEIVGPSTLILPIILLCHSSISSLHLDGDSSNTADILYVFVLFGIRSEDSFTRNLTCSLIVDIESSFPGMMKRVFSRREIEEALISRIEKSKSSSETISLLQASCACCRQLNMGPPWTPDLWCFPLTWQHRTIISPEISSMILGLLSKIEKKITPSRVHIFSLTLGFAVCLMKICCREKSLADTKSALCGSVIKFISKGLQIVISNQKIIRSNSGSNLIELQATSPHLLSSNYSIDLLYELVAFQTFEAVMTFLCTDDLKPYIENRDFFGEIPLSASILHITLHFKHNQNIQRQGLYIICYFARSGVELPVVINKSAEVLGSIISNLKRDMEVVSQFLYLLSFIIQSKRGPTSLSADYSVISDSKLDIHLLNLLIGNHIGPEDIISALTSFKNLTDNTSSCKIISSNSRDLPTAIIRILESPNTNPSLAVILALTSFTNLFYHSDFAASSDPATKRLLKMGKGRLSTMLRNDEPLPEFLRKKDLDKLISKCSQVEKCVLS